MDRIDYLTIFPGWKKKKDQNRKSAQACMEHGMIYHYTRDYFMPPLLLEELKQT